MSRIAARRAANEADRQRLHKLRPMIEVTIEEMVALKGDARNRWPIVRRYRGGQIRNNARLGLSGLGSNDADSISNNQIS